MDKLKALLAGESAATVAWIIAFTGVCILVGLNKVSPDLIENLLFAMGGAVAQRLSKGNGNGQNSK